jgi:hypothetical protein
MTPAAPRAAREAFARLYRREQTNPREPFTGSYLQFRRTILYSSMGCWLTQRQGVTIGIEPDGYTHT